MNPGRVGLVIIAFCMSILGLALGQSTPTTEPKPSSFLENMAGEWKVTQRVWYGPTAKATALPPALARRYLLAGGILEERMEAATGLKDDVFTRMSYLEYNPVTRQYEYFSIDTRAPQMMNERSYGNSNQGTDGSQPLSLWGGIFVAPKWGDANDAAFRYRIVIGPISQDRQLVSLYLTPVSREAGDEFLGFEYVYSREP